MQVALQILAITLAAAAQAQVMPFGTLTCVPDSGVRFCQGSVSTRVPSFDGVPLDVNVTLPAIGDERLPLVIQLHGWGGSKGGVSQSLEWAQDGYAVLNYTARGFGESCGTSSSRSADPVGCAEGWIHLADSRYEVRDSQYLAGLLVDQGIVHPRRIAATGVSYGGGQSLQLATLRKHMRLEDGTLTRWRSPGGRGMKLAAAAPIIPWSDLSAALLPNSRTLDYVLTGPTDDFTPIGVMKQSWVAVLYAAGAALGFYSPPGVDPAADIQTWYSFIQAGEPYDPMVADPIVQEVTANHSAFYLPARRPAPTLISNGFTDDLFPVNEALRWADRFRNRGPIAQFHYDSGHSRGQNKGADSALHNARIHAWFDRYVKRDKSATPMKGIEALTQTCGGPSAGPFSAPTWRELHPGEVRHTEAPVKTILSSADALGASVDPIAVGANCVTTSAADQAGTATYRLPATTVDGYTLLGHPTVIADLVVTGAAPTDTELAARLWDVAPGDTQQTLIARSVYRPAAASGQIIFQLNANGWLFAPGHVAKLELLGRDSPYARVSNFSFTLDVSNLDFRLPTRDLPDGGQVLAPAPQVLPPGAVPVP